MYLGIREVVEKREAIRKDKVILPFAPARPSQAKAYPFPV